VVIPSIMSVALLDSEAVIRARKSTEETSRAVDEWREQPPAQADPTDQLLAQATRLVDAWKEVVQIVDEANRNDAVDDYMALGDFLYPYVIVSEELLKAVDRLRDTSQAGIDAGLAADFQIARYEMGQVADFFERWPRSRSDLVASIREQYVRGDYRAFRDFLNEMQARHHADR
jgi:hypothetical protein